MHLFISFYVCPLNTSVFSLTTVVRNRFLLLLYIYHVQKYIYFTYILKMTEFRNDRLNVDSEN